MPVRAKDTFTTLGCGERPCVDEINCYFCLLSPCNIQIKEDGISCASGFVSLPFITGIVLNMHAEISMMIAILKCGNHT